MNEFEPDTTILSTYPADELVKDHFRNIIKAHDLEAADVKMVDREGSLLLITKRKIKLQWKEELLWPPKSNA